MTKTFGPDARAKVATRLRKQFFNEEARRSPGFQDRLAEQVRRVIQIAEARDGGPLDYDDLNRERADGAVLEGLIALDLVDDDTARRWYFRMARFMEAMTSAIPEDKPDATVGDFVTNELCETLWDATAAEKNH